MKQILQQFTLRASLLVMLLVGAVNGVWAEEVFYNLIPIAGTGGSYTGTCDITVDNLIWNVAGNAQMVPWRLGGKSLTKVDRSVYSKTAMGSSISKVELAVGTASSITVNSLKLIVASDANYTTVLDEVTATFEANSTITFTPSTGTEWATGAYYKFIFNVTVSSTSNKFLQFTNAKFYSSSTPSYTITAVSNDNNLGTVSLSGNVITADPADGCVFANPAYTVSSGTASVSQNGYEFTVTASSDCTVTINFMVKPTISGLSVDFENDLDSYIDWEFANAEIGSETISAHNGSYYATTGGKATANFQTKAKVANPTTFTCYVSKTTNNTTLSTWYVEVSSDGSEWTEVKSQSATSMAKGEWEEVTANLGTYKNVYVRLRYDGSTAIRTVDDISIVEGGKMTATVDLDKTSLNIGETATVTTDGPAVTLSTSDANVASVSGTIVTGVAAGTATITATWAENDEFEGGSKEFTVTVTDPNGPGTENNPYTVAQARSAIDANTGLTNVYATGIVSEIVTAYNSQYGNITYNISADGTTTADQLQAYRGKSYNGNNFTSEDDIKVGDVVVIFGNLKKYGETYEFDTDNQLVSLIREKTNPTISVEDASVAYGSTYTMNTELIEGGEITVTSGNTSVATVNGLVITPVAVGSVEITVETAESELYNAGSETFTLTVTAPEGKTMAPTASEGEVIFYESFNESTGTNDNFGSTTGDAAGTLVTDNDGWSYSEDSKNGAGASAKFGASKKKGGATTPSISAEIGTTYILTFKAAPWASEESSISVVAEGATISGISEGNMTNNTWNDFSATIEANANEFTLTFSASKNRFFLDEVKIEAPASGIPSEQYTIPVSGLGTYCSEYPLNLSALPEGVKAYVVESQTNESVTLVEAPSNVKGGTGLIIEGTGGTSVTFSFADCETMPSNLLVGTLAPTYLEANTVYGLKSGKFQPNTAGTIGAHRAYLPNESGNVKSLVIEFKDLVTGITRTRVISDEATIYDLTGRQVSKAEKGIYIVNGKKIAVK